MHKKRPFPKIPFFLCLLVMAVVFFQFRSYRMPFTNFSQKNLEDSFLSGSILKDGVPAIDHPKFESVNVADQYLNNDGLGIAVEVNRVSRFYPYQLLVWHHLVNESIQSEDILISFNPFAMSGTVYQRLIQGVVYDFGLSDTFANSNLLLYDRQTQSLWDPVKHQSVKGDKVGVILTRYPSTVMTWNAYKSLHPGGEVLSRDTGFDRDYTHDPYGNYRFDQSILFPVQHKDDRLGSKELVYGVEWNQKQKAYPRALLKKQPRIVDSLDATPISIEYDEKSGIVRAYQLDSTGNHQTEIFVTELYWFSWASAFPQTDLFKL
jgi:hypothetical protein